MTSTRYNHLFFYFSLYLHCFCYFAPILPANAQKIPSDSDPLTFHIKQYSIEQGLRQSMVSQIITDSNGLLWMVTGDGLHYFDGSKFKAYRIKQEERHLHSSNMMRHITEVEPGQFILSSSPALLHFSASNGKMRFLRKEEGTYFLLTGVTINDQALAWSGSDGFLLAGKEVIRSLVFNFRGAEPPAGFVPLKAVRTKTGIIIIQGNNGLIEFAPDGRINTSAKKGSIHYEATWIPQKDCRAIVTDQNGTIFLIKEKAIYTYYTGGRQQLKYYIGIDTDNALFCDKAGNLWFTDKEKSQLYSIDNKGMHAVHLIMTEGKHTDTVRSSVRYVYEDHTGNIWFGTDGHGLLKYDPHTVMFEKSMNGFTRTITGNGNRIFAGTFNNGLWEMEYNLKNPQRVLPGLFDNNSYILDLYSDSHQRIWVLSRKGLHVLSPRKQLVYTYPFTCLYASFIGVVDDSIQIQTESNLYTFSLNHRPNTPVIANPPSASDTGAGLHYTESFGLEFIHDEVWIATDNGVLVFDRQNKPISTYSSLLTQLDETIYALAADSYDRIWFSGLRGIGLISRDRSNITWFSTSNNLQSPEFNQNAFYKGSNGWLYFGGINGINAIDPSKVKSSKSKGNIRLLSLYVSDTLYTGGIPSGVPELNISRHAPHLRGSVFLTDYPDPMQSGISFLLENYSKDWLPYSGENTFSFYNLPPGRYRLLAKYTSGTNNTDTTQVLLTIHIKQAFWKTIWFNILLVIVVIAATIFLVKRYQRLRYQRKIKALEQMQAVERERLRISRDMHDEVGASLTRIAFLSELAKKQHDPVRAKELIHSISEISGNVVDELSEIIWAMNPKNDSLDRFAAYTRRYINTYLENTDIEVTVDFPDEIPSLPMTSEYRSNIFLVIKEAMHNIVKHASATAITIKMELKKDRITLSVSDNGLGIAPEFVADSNGNGLHSAGEPRGNGLHNMRRRMEDINGDLSIQTTPRMGTTIILTAHLQIHNTHRVNPHR